LVVSGDRKRRRAPSPSFLQIFWHDVVVPIRGSGGNHDGRNNRFIDFRALSPLAATTDSRDNVARENL